MYQINAIESKLKEMEAGRFQLLCNDILNSLGYSTVTNSGGQIGTDKTIKGTPDAYILCDDGNFIFIEYTVKQSDLLAKLKDDISKCLDVDKTKIPFKKIRKIILMYNSILSAGDLNVLSTMCTTIDIGFEKFDISNIALLINSRFPYLGKEVLGLSIDNGQFLDQKAFVVASNKGMLATTLDIDIIGREQEIVEITQKLDEASTIFLSGKSGVGKTRLALEILSRYEKQNPNVKIWYIRDLGTSLYNDLVKYTSNNDKYIVFIDDINKLTGIEAILDYLSSNLDKIKLIATIRDYALKSSVEKISKYLIPELINIVKLNDDVIRNIAETKFKIYNSDYLSRITKLSQGNPRLAVMMAIVAVKEQKLSSISNISQLLEKYYDEIRKKFDQKNDVNRLKALGIIAFLDKLYFEDNDSLNTICNLIDINKQELYNIYLELFRMEIVDIYEDEVVCISDQILSIFIFHYVFEIRKILDYADIIKVYFTKYKNRIIQNINSIIIYYDNLDFFSNSIKKVWDEWEEEKNSNLEDLMLTFWFARELHALNYLNKQIGKIPVNHDILEDYLINDKTQYEKDKIINTLGQLANSNHFKISIDLILKYLKRDNTKIKEVSYVLTHNFGYTKHSYNQGYFVQDELIKIIMSEIEDDKTQMIFYQILTNIIPYFLSYESKYTESINKKTFTFMRVTLYAKGKMLEMRDCLWDFIAMCLEDPLYNEYAYKILDKYSKSRFLTDENELYEYDFNKINTCILKNLNLDSFDDCLLIDNVEKNIFKHKGYCFKLKEKVKSNTYKIYKMLSEKQYDFDDEWRVGKLKKEEYLETCIHNLDPKLYYDFFLECNIIKKAFKDKDLYTLRESLEVIFHNVKIEYAFDFLKAYLKANIPLNVNPIDILERLICNYSYKQVKMIIESFNFDNKDYWEYLILSLIPKSEVNVNSYHELVGYFNKQESFSVGCYRSLEFLEKFIVIDSEIFVTISRMIMNKKDKFLKKIYIFSLFRDEEKFKNIIDLFISDHNLLIHMYLFLIGYDNFYDRKNIILTDLLNVDYNIIYKLCDTIFATREDGYHLKKIDYDFSFLWDLDNHIIMNVIEYVVNNHCEYIYGNNLEELFIVENLKETVEKQDSIIIDYIRTYKNDIEKMKILFDVIAKFDEHRRLKHTIYFIKENKSIKDFKAIPLENQFESWSGSQLPLVYKKIEFYKKLNEDLSGIDYLEHKEYLEKIVESYKGQIHWIKINEFLRDY